MTCDSRRWFFALALVSVLVLFVPVSGAGEEPSEYEYDDMLYGPDNPLTAFPHVQALLSEGNGRLPRARILVSKKRHALELYSGGLLLKTYRIELSADSNPKERAGDKRTPEGAYFICEKRRNSVFYRDLLLSYPNPEDGRRGVENQIIQSRALQEIEAAARKRGCPAQDTALGGEVLIHGQAPVVSPVREKTARAKDGSGEREKSEPKPRHKERGRDWTNGSISLSNADVGELFDLVPLGTPVEIRADFE